MASAGQRVGAREGAPSSVPDAALLVLAADGDLEAFDTLLRPRLDRLFRIAVAILRSEADARDAVQDASIRAWSALPRLLDRDRFDAWLTQILVNCCRSMLRQRRRGEVREIHFDDIGAEVGSAVTPRPPTRDYAEVDAVQRAFDRLDPTSRSLLVLHYVDERPLKEIGPLTGTPVGTVKWRLWRARRALERALEGERR
jgi:RNA polymerase sigma-70 factor (ECF subfamily)